MNDFAFSIDLARQLDPTLIAADCGYKLDKWQAELMRSVSRRVLMLCSRQCGKTTTAGFMGLHKAVYSPGSLVLIVSPSQRQSGEMLRSIMANYRKLTDVPAIKDESVLRVEFKNGSRLIALHGEERTLRGYAGANLIILDEAARVPDELISALTTDARDIQWILCCT
jgi:tRNA(Met) C34 N-acetyltransferase TmcA